MKPKTSQRWLVSLLLVNLLIGIVIGILLDQYFLTPAEARPDAHNKRPTGIQGLKPPKPRMLEKLGQMLDLSDEQHAALSVLLEKHHKDERKMFMEHRQKSRAARADFFEEIKVELSPVQQEKFQEMLSRLEERHRRMETMRRQKMLQRKQSGKPPQHHPGPRKPRDAETF